MDGQADEDGLYSDDELDALPHDAFEHLQAEALRSTQQAQKIVQSRVEGFGHHTSGAPNNVNGFAEQPAAHAASSDYGDFEDEMLDGEIIDGAKQPPIALGEAFNTGPEHGESTQREHWRHQRYARPPNVLDTSLKPSILQSTTHKNLPQIQSITSASVQARQNGISNGSIKNAGETSADVDALQNQIQRLLREREAMQRATRVANDEAFAKTGEIAIVRANALKAEREHETRTKALQRQHADEAARQKMEMDRARVELQKITTEKDFLANDLVEGTKQIKRLELAIKRGSESAVNSKGPVNSPLTTPRKNKSTFADGFDEAELQPMSPSELALRAKGGTPKAGTKRKRKQIDPSPVKSLQLGQSFRQESFEGAFSSPALKEVSEVDVFKSLPVVKHDKRFDFIQALLDHRDPEGEQRIVEALAAYKLPSRKDTTLATLLYDRILSPGVKSGDSLPAAVALEIIALWSQCLHEHVFDAVHLFMDLISHILILSPLRTAPELTNSIMELIQETADVIIIPRCQKKPAQNDTSLISSLDCLRLMQLLAQDCSMDEEEITRFWRTVRFDFLMMMLSFVHPLQEIRAIVRLLHTGILEKTFAMIIPPGDGKQDATEARVIDNLSRLLVESPRTTTTTQKAEPALTSVELSTLRLEILDLMNAMCEHTYGFEALTKHRLVIGRLVRVMNDELERAYDRKTGFELRITLVNEATRLLYLLTTSTPSEDLPTTTAGSFSRPNASTPSATVNMQTKLSVIPGGEKKYLIALTRLAFSEGTYGYLEQGIEDDVIEQAHQMLEMRVSPEEAEQLVEAFASGHASRRGPSREPVVAGTGPG